MFQISATMNLVQGLVSTERFQAMFRRFLQRLGMYSIRRGLADRPSIAQTLDLLEQPGTHLVIFPEGGCSFQNDTVMPFRPGGVQLALQTLNRFARQQRPLPDLYVLPVTIKYVYTQDMGAEIQRTLERLEAHLGVTPAKDDTYARLRGVAEAVLVQLEQEYPSVAIEEAGPAEIEWNQRIQALRHRVLASCEQQLSLAPSGTLLVRERVYRVQHAIQQAVVADLGEGNAFCSTLAVERAMARLLNFDAIYDGYVAEKPTPERFLDTLVRLEREVFNIDQPPPKGRRRALITLGKAVNLKQHFEDYCRDRSGTVEHLITDIKQQVQTALDAHQSP